MNQAAKSREPTLTFGELVFEEEAARALNGPGLQLLMSQESKVVPTRLFRIKIRGEEVACSVAAVAQR